MSSSKLFKTAAGGYKKEDVNKYIISINKEIAALQAKYEQLCTQNDALSNDTVQLKSKNATLQSECDRLSLSEASLSRENETLRTELEALKKENGELLEAKNDTKTYESLCAKAGEVLLIASTTADDILKRANDEAHKIISDVECRKENMIESITQTAEYAADGLSDYIKGAVDECIGRINSSIREVGDLKTTK